MADQAPAAPTKSDGSVQPVKLGNRLVIHPDQPLPALASGPALAFAARDLSPQGSGEVYALIATDAAPPRTEMVPALRGIRNPGLLPVIEGGVVDWPLEGRARYAVVLGRPAGPRLMPSLDTTFTPLAHEPVLRAILAPLAAALTDLSQRGLFHGAVRPTNIFHSADSGTVVLGDCVSTSPSFLQPAMFEPIERAMADAIGRGAGNIGDDLYALGVSVFLLLAGGNPLRHLSEAEVTEARIERGSFAALTGSVKLSSAVAEPLRGLLHDDPKLRWSISDLTTWLGGQRLGPRPHQAASRNASRTFAFSNKELPNCRAVAHAFAGSASDAARAIESGDIERWVRMSMADPSCADRLVNAANVSAAAGKNDGYEQRLVARVCVALDPTGPIRYKGRTVMPSGLGRALAVAVAAGSGTQELAEIIAQQLPGVWYDAQPDSRPEYVPLAKEFSRWRMILARTGYGSGLERCVYELDNSVRCLSPIVAKHYVLNAADLLRALEKVAAAPDKPAMPMDRHIAAFLVARDRRVGEGLLGLMAENADPAERVAALLNLFGTIQERSGPKELPKLCAWLAALSEPALRKFHSRDLRDRIKGQLKEVAAKGSIPALQQLVDDPAVIERDREDFEKARAEYGVLERQVVLLKKLIAEPKKIERGHGREVAGICSALLSMVVLAGIFAMNLILPGFGL